MPRIPGLNAFGNDVAPVVPSAPGPRVVQAAYDKSSGIAEMGAGFQSAADTVNRAQQIEAARLAREAEKIKAEQDRAARVEEVTRAKRDQVALEERAAAERQRLLDDASVPNEAKPQKLNEWVTAERSKLEATYKIPDVLGGQQVAIDELRARQTAELNNGIKTRNQEQTRANVAGTLEGLGRRAAQAADPTPFIEDGIAHVTAAGAAAGWGADDVAKINMQLGETLSAAAVGRRILEDPAGALDDMKAGKYPYLSPEAATGLEARAQGEIEQRATRARIEAEVRAAKAGRAMNELGQSMRDGVLPTPAMVATAAELARGTEFEGTIKSMQSQYVDRAAFAGRPLAEQFADVQRMEAAATDPAVGLSPEDRWALNWKRQQAGAVARDVEARGGLVVAAAHGIVEYQPLDLSSPEALAGSLESRKEAVLRASVWTGRSEALLTPIEIKDLSDTLKRTPAHQQGTVLAGFAKAIGDPVAFRSVMRELAPDNGAAAWAGKELISRAPGSDRAASLVLRGESYLNPANGETKPVSMPKDSVMRSQFAAVVEDTYGNRAQSREMDYQNTRRVYAALSADANDYASNPDTYDPVRFAEAVKIASGGLGEYNGAKIIMPRGVDEQQLTDLVRTQLFQMHADGQIPGFTVPQLNDLLLEPAVRDGAEGYFLRQGGGNLKGRDGRNVFIDPRGAAPMEFRGDVPLPR